MCEPKSLFAEGEALPRVKFSFKQKSLKGEVTTLPAGPQPLPLSLSRVHRLPSPNLGACPSCRGSICPCRFATDLPPCPPQPQDSPGFAAFSLPPSLCQDMALVASPLRLPGKTGLDFHLYAIFDGHNGDETARFCKKNVARELLPRLPAEAMPPSEDRQALEVRLVPSTTPPTATSKWRRSPWG